MTVRVRGSNTGKGVQGSKSGREYDCKGVREKENTGSVMKQTQGECGSEGVREKTECEGEVVREQHGGNVRV